MLVFHFSAARNNFIQHIIVCTLDAKKNKLAFEQNYCITGYWDNFGWKNAMQMILLITIFGPLFFFLWENFGCTIKEQY